VNYIAKGQQIEGLTFGAWQQTQPPRIDEDIAIANAAGIDVYAMKEDIDERGIDLKKVIAGVKLLERAQLLALMEGHGQIWNW
jgi:sulfur transfer complex TusBCD TusB component (DsrH family)